MYLKKINFKNYSPQPYTSLLQNIYKKVYIRPLHMAFSHSSHPMWEKGRYIQTQLFQFHQKTNEKKKNIWDFIWNCIGHHGEIGHLCDTNSIYKNNGICQFCAFFSFSKVLRFSLLKVCISFAKFSANKFCYCKLHFLKKLKYAQYTVKKTFNIYPVFQLL